MAIIKITIKEKSYQFIAKVKILNLKFFYYIC